MALTKARRATPKRLVRRKRTDENTLVPDSTKRRVYAEMELKKAFGEMVADIREHNAEYHHHTPEEKIKAWEKRLTDWEKTWK